MNKDFYKSGLEFYKNKVSSLKYKPFLFETKENRQLMLYSQIILLILSLLYIMAYSPNMYPKTVDVNIKNVYITKILGRDRFYYALILNLEYESYNFNETYKTSLDNNFLESYKKTLSDKLNCSLCGGTLIRYGNEHWCLIDGMVYLFVVSSFILILVCLRYKSKEEEIEYWLEKERNYREEIGFIV